MTTLTWGRCGSDLSQAPGGLSRKERKSLIWGMCESLTWTYPIAVGLFEGLGPALR
jgi:hypothetical protein